MIVTRYYPKMNKNKVNSMKITGILIQTIFALLASTQAIAYDVKPVVDLEKKCDRIEQRLDNRGYPINLRLNRKGGCIDNRLDQRGDRAYNRLGSKVQKVNHRLDRRKKLRNVS
jgi:hypothetical protein